MKKSFGLILGFIVILSIVPSLPALNTGTDLLVPAAGRGNGWVTDLYILNPGSQTAMVSVFWLPRKQANTDPAHMEYSLSAGQTLSLEDVILSVFGLSSAGGAFHVTAGHPVLVNSRIYSSDGSQTFGQGFEGFPLSMATGSGNSTDIVGLAVNDSFRTNVYGCAGADGATITFALHSLNGTEIATADKTLRAWEPFLLGADVLLGSGDFDDGTLHATVSAGAAVLGASKVDEDSTDPTTLESSAECAASDSTGDGDYQLGFYDSFNYATGGHMRIENGSLSLLDATYTNWDKVDSQGNPACKWIFLFGSTLSGNPTLAELEAGITIVSDYSASELGTITYTLSLSASGQGFSGTLEAEGAGFPADVDGCNGTFPPQQVAGGTLPLE